MSKTRVLLVDDHALFREGLANILNAQPDFAVVGEAGDGLEVLIKAKELMPDLILMDINMPGCDGLEATQRIKEELSITIVMLTVRDDDEKLFQAIRSGAQGYLLKSIRSWELVNLLRGVVRGEAAITPALAGRMLEEFRRLGQHQARKSPSDETVTLTTREQSVLGLVAACATDEEIADELGISVHTVKSHMRNILTKLQQAQSDGMASGGGVKPSGHNVFL
jgi:DNA-binding NarL/FixJ family response regulator